MKILLSTLLFLAGVSVLFAQDTPPSGNPFEIKTMQRAVKLLAYVSNAWKSNAPCIQAEVRVTRDIGSTKPYVRAYFFDREKNLLESFKGPVEVSESQNKDTAMPAFFKPHQPYKVCFPITERTTQPGKSWSRVIIVFGDKTYATAECFPKDEMASFDFPEKDLAMKSAPPPPGQAAPITGGLPAR
jgi:hypothetical protein